MTGERSVTIGGDATGAVVTTGDHDIVYAAELVKTPPPVDSGVDIEEELRQIRAILDPIVSEHKTKIGHALDEATEEAKKPAPDKDEIGKALSRALIYANKGEALTDKVAALAPHLSNAVDWLGSAWNTLQSSVGIST